MSMPILPEFRDHLSDFIDHYVSLGPPTGKPDDEDENEGNRRPLKTARVVSGSRRYFLDLKENVRGRYLRVRAPGQNPEMPQQVIVIPALGMVEFRNTISKVIDEFGPEHIREDRNLVKNSNRNDGELPNSAAIGSRRTKIFYLDSGENNRGIFCRMTEQSANFRQSLTVPDRYFREIGEWFLNAADQLEGRGNFGRNNQHSRRNDGQDDRHNDDGHHGRNGNGDDHGNGNDDNGNHYRNGNNGNNNRRNNNRNNRNGNRNRNRNNNNNRRDDGALVPGSEENGGGDNQGENYKKRDHQRNRRNNNNRNNDLGGRRRSRDDDEYSE